MELGFALVPIVLTLMLIASSRSFPPGIVGKT